MQPDLASSPDIEDAKRAGEAPAVSEHDLRAIIDTIPTTAWTARPDGSCDFINQRWLEYAGMTAQQALGWGWRDAIHPADRERLVEYWQRCLASGTPVDTEARVRRCDGAYRWFLFRANPSRDEAGNICKWYGTSIDIEDRKQAEEGLQSNERSLRLLINSIPMSIQVLGTDGSLLYTNQVVLDYHGLTAAEAQQPEIRARIFHPDDVARLREERRQALLRPVPFENEQRALGKDGTYRWFLIRYSPLLDAHGNIDRWYAAGFDIEDRKQAEQALNAARAELAHVSRITTLGTLTASIAHEVNQPLAGIITNAATCLRMLNADPPNVDGARATTQRTLRDGNRASEVIQRLRTLYSHEEPKYEPVDLNAAAREVLALSMSELQRGHVTVRTDLDADLPVVKGDRVQLQQVLLNLILNAADAMREVGDRPRDLRIATARADSGQVRLSVRDSGVGIDPQRLEKVFDAFYTTKPSGMGIGLSISRAIIQSHQGRLWATANDGPGATFSFCIPCESGGCEPLEQLPTYR